MKIAIIGSRGIPNRYGGFEQFAQIVSGLWVEMGHEVICYSPENHTYPEDTFHDVKIVKVFCPERILGPFAHFIYDYLSLRSAVKNNCDIFLQLGYQSSAPSYLLFKNSVKKRIVTNMDGMEWMRSKWSYLVKLITKISEIIAVHNSGKLIADNKGIHDYILEKYNKHSDIIAYGCDKTRKVDRSKIFPLISQNEEFDLVICRIEPENNVQTIIEAYIRSCTSYKLIIIGGLETKFSNKIVKKYKDFKNIKFIGGIYDQDIINAFRQNSRFYFHGHSVGGTNPSLIEAMESKCRIIAHKNKFNISVLGTDAEYFSEINDLERLLKNDQDLISLLDQCKQKNHDKIINHYQWKDIAQKYIDTFEKVLS